MWLGFFFSSRMWHMRFDCDWSSYVCFFFFKQKTAYEILTVTGVQTCALPICPVAGDLVVPRARALSRGGAISPRRVPALFHPGPVRAVVDRHDGSVHPAAHAGFGPPPAARRRDRGADRRTRRGHPGAVAGTATQSRPPGPRTGRGRSEERRVGKEGRSRW